MDIEVTPKTWGTYWDIFGTTLTKLLDIQSGATVLDVGTGGGSVLYAALEKVGSKGKVKGIDIRQHWVDTTNAEIERCKIDNARVYFMDGRELKFDDNTFDYVSAGFIGWDDWFDFDTCEFIDQDLMMSEIRRVLRPNGTFGYSTWLCQYDLDWMYQFLTSHGIDAKTNYSIENEAGWRKIMSNVGLKEQRFFSESVSYTYKSIDFWWKEMMDYTWVKEKENSVVITESIKNEAFELIQSHLTNDGGIPFKRDALFALGTK